MFFVNLLDFFLYAKKNSSISQFLHVCKLVHMWWDLVLSCIFRIRNRNNNVLNCKCCARGQGGKTKQRPIDRYIKYTRRALCKFAQQTGLKWMAWSYDTIGVCLQLLGSFLFGNFGPDLCVRLLNNWLVENSNVQRVCFFFSSAL